MRTSSGYFLKRGQDEVVGHIEQRLANWTRLPMENGEPLHVSRQNTYLACLASSFSLCVMLCGILPSLLYGLVQTVAA